MSKKGVTLVELIVATMLVAIVAVALTPYIRAIHNVWIFGDRRTEMLQHARVSMDRMVRTLREALVVTEIDVSGQSTNKYIAFVDKMDRPIVFFHNIAGSEYYYSDPAGDIEDNDLVMQLTDGTGTTVNSLLAKSLESFTFTYLKQNLDELDPATLAEDVQAVQIDMVLSDWEGILSKTLPVSSLVHIRKLYWDIIMKDLVSWWKMDEGMDTTVSDAIGSNNGTIYNASWIADGKINAALNFDGNRDYVEVADSNNLDLINEGTLEAWIYPTTLKNGTVMVKGEGGTKDRTYIFGINARGKLRLGLADGSSISWHASKRNLILTGQWQHVAAAWDGTDVRLYYNGILNKTMSQKKVPFNSDKPLRIGALITKVEFKGDIDEVRIYDRKITDGEVKQNYYATK